MTGRMHWIWWLLIWVIATYLVLLLPILNCEDEICDLQGPWGCLPPTLALVAAHAFWMMVLILPLSWSISCLAPTRLFRLGSLLLAASSIGLLAVIAWSVSTWESHFGVMTVRSVSIRIGFFLAKNYDFPVVQLGLTGFACWLASRWKRIAVNQYLPSGSQSEPNNGPLAGHVGE